MEATSGYNATYDHRVWKIGLPVRSAVLAHCSPDYPSRTTIPNRPATVLNIHAPENLRIIGTYVAAATEL
ncbi:hypothetical protein VN97_g8622 [Penicillium thymicola]|uniref:Uncharacterized protein n=1 Tax=Penicillium thymicola TaxID=293382 RepID=A0AAI9TCF8_PENTH|nr:hypothetical protein VN97_g8622 [Penicillium thymicola]